MGGENLFIEGLLSALNSNQNLLICLTAVTVCVAIRYDMKKVFGKELKGNAEKLEKLDKSLTQDLSSLRNDISNIKGQLQGEARMRDLISKIWDGKIERRENQ